jgi:hypothetical protein
MRTQAAAPAGHRNMQTPPRSARMARDSLRAGNQASEHRIPISTPKSPQSGQLCQYVSRLYRHSCH